MDIKRKRSKKDLFTENWFSLALEWSLIACPHFLKPVGGSTWINPTLIIAHASSMNCSHFLGWMLQFRENVHPCNLMEWVVCWLVIIEKNELLKMDLMFLEVSILLSRKLCWFFLSKISFIQSCNPKGRILREWWEMDGWIKIDGAVASWWINKEHQTSFVNSEWYEPELRWWWAGKRVRQSNVL